MKRKKNDCLCARKGFGTIYLILLLQMILSVLLLVQLRITVLIRLKNQEITHERIEIQLVQHLKKVMPTMPSEPEDLIFENTSVHIEYDETEALVTIDTSPIKQVHVVYDDIWMCISEFEYIDALAS